MTNDELLAKADAICGITTRCDICRNEGFNINTYRRGGYFEWIEDQDCELPTRLSAFASLADIAAEVVRIHEEAEAAKRPKCPDDGLPPGPWWTRFGAEEVETANGTLVAHAYRVTGMASEVSAYIARCGSPAVRRLLHAFDVTDEEQPIGTFSNALCVTPNGNMYVTTAPPDGVVIICWLTPREAKR